MKFLTKAALAATVATGLFASPALAAPAGDVDFIAKATIVKPVTIANQTDLDFGTVVMQPTLISEVVTVGDALNDVAVCGSGQLTCSGGGSADFTLTGGVAGQTITLTYDNPTGVLLHTNGTDTVGYVLDPAEDVLLDSFGKGKFSVGGEITVVAATVDGDYSATINVEANYL